MIPPAKDQRHLDQPFIGFEPLVANFFYVPNQFYDVCLPNCSRGAVRFVAYLLRKTLGWVDANGNPMNEIISIPHLEFIRQAKISKGALNKAVEEVTDLGFVNCIRQGRKCSQDMAAQSAEYSLRWSDDKTYVADLGNFKGFFAANGNVTPTPNDFFDILVPNYKLSTTKVVGTVLRRTIGFESKYGGRCREASLSYQKLRRYTGISDYTTLTNAINESVKNNFIAKIAEGRFDHRDAVQKATVYGPKWLSNNQNERTSSKTIAEARRSKNQSSTGSITRVEERFKNQSTIKKQSQNTINKQQPVAAISKIKNLLQPWFDRSTINKLLVVATPEEIQNQIDWLAFREPSSNEAGMLRKAIEENWVEPHKYTQKQQQVIVQAETVHSRKNHRQVRLQIWDSLSEADRENARQRAVKNATSESLKRLLQRSTNQSQPHWFVLEQIAFVGPSILK